MDQRNNTPEDDGEKFPVELLIRWYFEPGSRESAHRISSLILLICIAEAVGVKPSRVLDVFDMFKSIANELRNKETGSTKQKSKSTTTGIEDRMS